MAPKHRQTDWIATQAARQALKDLLSTQQWNTYDKFRYRCVTDRENVRPETAAKHTKDLRDVIDFSPETLDAHNNFARNFNMATTGRGLMPIFSPALQQEDAANHNSKGNANSEPEDRPVDANRAGGEVKVSENANAQDTDAMENASVSSVVTAGPPLEVITTRYNTDISYYYVKNPEEFDLKRIRNWGFAHRNCEIDEMRVVLRNGKCLKIDVTLLNGPVRLMIISDPRIINKLRLGEQPNPDEIKLRSWDLPQNPRIPSYSFRSGTGLVEGVTWGNLIVPRHSYAELLYWRKERFPEKFPREMEIRKLAGEIGFHDWRDLRVELADAWYLEHGPRKDHYRSIRIEWLGEDPITFEDPDDSDSSS
ncbi:hypothetical protein P280DRAFT_484647 [Massarina eburnea CBS 473.64]|uniref:Uncharacterized protein n=1 Tax=Massarina eburnea CBS 473.64 TaxID=1395130 RepID=A0A6A6RJB4_9PLEO|nr:hypothetical protein P280DRAFT_484647 [Massarina eburnea CBS 473.64]